MPKIIIISNRKLEKGEEVGCSGFYLIQFTVFARKLFSDCFKLLAVVFMSRKSFLSQIYTFFIYKKVVGKEEVSLLGSNTVMNIKEKKKECCYSNIKKYNLTSVTALEINKSGLILTNPIIDRYSIGSSFSLFIF